jgi:hypothetical protein
LERTQRKITDQKDIQFLVSLKEEDITTSLINEIFGDFKGKRRFNPYDEFILPANSYGPEGKKNKNSFVTTVGIFIFNKYFIEKDLFDIFHYVNKELDSDSQDDLNEELSYAVMEDDIEVKTLSRYLMKLQKFMPYVSILSIGFTEKMLTCTDVLNVRKKELLKKYAKEIEAGDEITADKIQKELLAYAKEYLGDDESMDMYLSGARGSFGNNFKDMFVMKGAVRNPDPNAKKQFDIATSNYIDGIKAEEYTLYANSLSAGPYARSNKTAVGGFWEKLFRDAFQHLILLDEGSDCGTTDYVEVELDSKNIKDFMYCYVIEGAKLTEITSKNKSKFIDKKVKLRFANMCSAKGGICNKCAGNLYYRLGLRNIGVSLTQIPSVLKNKMMKNFHDSQVKFTEMDPMKAFSIK